METIDLYKIKKIEYGANQKIDVTEKISVYLSEHKIITDSTNIHAIIMNDPNVGIMKTLDFHGEQIIKVNEGSGHLYKAIITTDFVDKITEITKNIATPIVLTFTDSKYLPIFDIFYEYFSKFNLTNLLVVALDTDAHTYLNSKKINTILIKYNKTINGNFWRFRSNIINAIFKIAKKDLIHTDSDCIWIKNIIPLINNMNDYNVVAQIEFGHPFSISNVHGFIMCCGFYKLTYSNKTIELIDKTMEQWIDDDQVSFNTYIFKNKQTTINHNNTNTIIRTLILRNQYKIGLLNGIYSTREYQNVRPNNKLSVMCNNRTYCFHPWLSQSDVADKKKFLLRLLDEGMQRSLN